MSKQGDFKDRSRKKESIKIGWIKDFVYEHVKPWFALNKMDCFDWGYWKKWWINVTYVKQGLCHHLQHNRWSGIQPFWSSIPFAEELTWSDWSSGADSSLPWLLLLCVSIPTRLANLLRIRAPMAGLHSLVLSTHVLPHYMRECTHLQFLVKQRTCNSAIILQPKVSSHGHNFSLRAEADSELPSPHADAVLIGKVKCQREWQQKLGIPQFSYCNNKGYNKIKAHNWIEYESSSCKIPYCSAWSK